MHAQIKAVAYYRMSSDDQNTSIEQQRREVRAYAKEQGYEIVHEYVDEGTSGSKDQHKRIEFARMLTDAASHGFMAVLCWNTSRFARLDSFDAVMAKQVLRTNGIHLNTVKEGKIDWNTFEGRILDMLRSESDHKFSRDISASTLRGRLDALERGYWPNGAVPYGYDRLYVSGDKCHLIKRNESFRKPRTWQLKLVVNEAEAKVVRWLFHEFCCRDTSLRQLALELSNRGVPSPGNNRGGWSKDSVKAVLGNRAYIGIGHIGLGRQRAKEAFNRAVPTEKAGCCPVIVDPAIYDAAQKRLDSRRDADRKPHSTRSSALSGCVVCGHCGYRMDKKERKGRIYFTCSSAMRRPHLGCRQWRANEDELLPTMTHALVNAIDFEVLKSIQSQPRQQTDVGLELLETRADFLRRDIERGNERYLKAPSDLLAGLEEKLLGWKNELALVEEQIRQSALAKNRSSQEIFSRWWERVRGKLVVVSELEWGEAKTGRRPIQLCSRDRKAIQKHIGGKVGACRVAWTGDPDAGFEIELGNGNLIELDCDGNAWELTEVEFPVNPAVMAERDSLSALLHDLKVRITLFWKPRNGRYFELDRRRLQAEISENFLGARTVTRGRVTNIWG